jgi:hypothetical protein
MNGLPEQKPPSFPASDVCWLAYRRGWFRTGWEECPYCDGTKPKVFWIEGRADRRAFSCRYMPKEPPK